MKKAIVLALLSLTFLPLTASAAWWNPFTWKNARTTPATASTTASTSVADLSSLPTTDDLYRRIAELELKLDRAREDLEKAQSGAKPSAVSASVPTPAAPSASSGANLASKDILAKVRPSIVLVIGASSSAAGSIIDAQGHILTAFHVMGTSTSVNVSLSSGVTKRATLVGLEEANDLAVLQLSDKKSSSYLSLNYGSASAVGDGVYVVGFPGSQSTGLSLVSAIVTQKTSSSMQATSDSRPFDNGSALISAKGGLIGMSGSFACKVLEEGKTCLKYTITTNLFPSRVPLLVQGMKLYKDKKDKTAVEVLFRGYLDGLYANINQSDSIKFAVDSVTGKNSFDYFNGKLNSDTEDKIPRLYAIKLKAAAQNIAKAFDSLKSISYAFRVFLIDYDGSVAKLDPYQQKVLGKLQADNDVRLKAYQAQVDLWTRKKNEYDAYVVNPSDATRDYLMAESVSVDTAAELLGKERQKILDSLSGDVLEVF
ncbi:MAG: serine protease [Candidatus Paceibacterota bacterium]|jgi:putative serine protease PepD